jgi:hypothetical protein
MADWTGLPLVLQRERPERVISAKTIPSLSRSLCALLPKADIRSCQRHVRFGPKVDIRKTRLCDAIRSLPMVRRILGPWRRRHQLWLPHARVSGVGGCCADQCYLPPYCERTEYEQNFCKAKDVRMLSGRFGPDINDYKQSCEN